MKARLAIVTDTPVRTILLRVRVYDDNLVVGEDAADGLGGIHCD